MEVEALMAEEEVPPLILGGLICGVLTLSIALLAILAVVLSGRHKSKSAPDRNEFADLRDEVADLRAEVERLKAGRPSHGSTDIH
jgi:hypothetical protein